jgi:DNA-binding transcriptional regulator YdaS (Cro superfamily)
MILTVILLGVAVGCSSNSTGSRDDGGSAASAGSAAATPEDAVALYLRAMAGEVPLEQVKPVLDWESLKRAAEAKQPMVRRASMQRFQQGVMSRMQERVGSITPEQLAMILPRLEADVQGDRATIAMPEREGAAFTLRKLGSGWAISGFPRRG